MRKSIVAASMAASLTLGGAAGAALFTPTLSGAQTDTDTDTDTGTSESTTAEASGHATAEEHLGEVLAPLVQDGTITQAQADAVVDTLIEAGPRHGRVHLRAAMFPALDSVAELFGMTAEELRASLADGRTLADLAESEGVDVDEVVAILVAAAEEHLDDKVADGDLTEDEAADRLAEIETRITEFVENGGPAGGHGRGRGPRPFHDGGPDGSAPGGSGSDTTDS